ncbi:TRAP transporter large permease [Chloroflexota bacterium]
MDHTTVGIIGVVIVFVFLALGMPVGFSFMITGFLGIFWLKGFTAAVAMSSVIPFSWATSISLMCIPLFILMGMFSFHSGISRDLFSMGNKFLGRFPGGLNLANAFACAAFSATTGSSSACAATMGTVSWPELQARKYNPGFGAATIAASGSLGIMIPPSTVFIFYGLVTYTSIGKLFIAGIIPGLIEVTLYVIAIVVLVKLMPQIAPLSPFFSLKEKFESLKTVWAIVSIVTIVLGGIYFGFFTPTEAAGIGSFATFVLMVLRRGATKQNIISSLLEAGRLTCMIFILIIGVMFFVSFISLTGVTKDFCNWVVTLPLPRYVTLSLILSIYLPLGCFMTSIPMIALTIPFVFPVVTSLGFDPIWLGVLLVRFGETSTITPPVGMNVFVLSGVTGIPSEKIFKWCIPYIIMDLICIMIIIAVPQTTLFLPSTMMK